MIIHLKLLVNMFSCTNVVPDCFGIGITVPFLKNRLVDMCDTSNYCAITLCPVIAKLFEHCIISKYTSYIHINDLQFGFVVFVTKQCVDYFV